MVALNNRRNVGCKALLNMQRWGISRLYDHMHDNAVMEIKGYNNVRWQSATPPGCRILTIVKSPYCIKPVFVVSLEIFVVS